MDPFDSSGNQSGAPPAGVRSAAANAAVLDIDNLPLEQLLQSEWFHQNISQMLNISVDNLTSLLINAQHQQQLQQQTAAAANSTGLGGLAGGNSSSSSVERDPLWLLATLTIFYALIFVAGVLGNLITCIVISRNKFMHTATNFYLFNLAVSDLILLLSGMPQELYNTWYPEEYPFTDLLCKMEGIFSETAANATVLTITAFTVERYIAICHPFRQHTMSKLSRAIKFIFAIWVTAFLLALPQAMQFSVVPQYSGLSCTMKNDFFEHVFAVSGFIFFGGPMTAICVLYVLIGVKLKRSRLLQAVPRRCYDVNRGISAQSRVIRMLVAVAVAFFLCWAPFHAQRLMAAYGSTAGVTSELFNRVYHILNYISGVLYFLSTCINPLLYNIMSHKFREAFKVTLARHFGLAGKYQTQSHNYSALLRQNGSMRLHTTDSIRTTTTTTTVNSASGGGGGGSGCGGGGGGSASNSCRSSHRNRCISIGSQATLLTSLSKNDVFAAAPGPTQTQTQSQTPTPAQRSGAEHRLLQRQISQLSSVGDASSLFEADLGAHFHPHPHPHPQHHRAASRLKELRRSLASANGSAQAATGAGPGPEADCLSLDSQDWAAAGPGSGPERGADSETELVTKPVAPPLAPAAPPLVTPMHSIAELPSRSRLKLSRIISRRDEDAFAAQTSPRVELMRTHLPGMGHLGRPALLQPQPQPHPHPHLPKKPNLPTRTRPKTLESLAERFRWRARRPKAAAPESPAAAQPPAALMRVVYPATAASTETETELARTNGGGALFATSKAL